MFRPSLGLFESSWRFWEPKCGNAHFWPLTWPGPDTWPFKKNFKSALEPSRRDLSNAASPVSLRSLVWELAWVGVIRPPPRSMAFGWDPSQARVNDLSVTSDVTGQVKVKMFDIHICWIGLARKTTMLNANEANESVWMGSRTRSVSITRSTLWPYSTSRSSEITMSKKSVY